MKRTAIVSGVTGQDGSYMADLLLAKGYQVYGMKRRSSANTLGCSQHLAAANGFEVVEGDLNDFPSLLRLCKNARADEFYNLAAQSHVGTSFEQPQYTLEATGLGVLNCLEAIRLSGIHTRFYNAATSELFGGTTDGKLLNEESEFHPRSPYAAAKLYGYWMTRLYRDSYKMFACNGILFNHECVTADTPVIIRRGNMVEVVRIDEIVPHRSLPAGGRHWTTDVAGGYEVWDHNGQWAQVLTATATYNDASNDKEVHRINVRGGFYEATRDHISFREDGTHVPTGDLSPGDMLHLVPLPDLGGPCLVSDDLAEFLGMMAACGYVAPGGTARFTKNDDALRARAAHLWVALGGGKSREDEGPSGYDASQMVKRVELNGSPEFGTLLRSMLYDERDLKRVPRVILNADHDAMRAFVLGYNRCDGLKGGNQKTELKSFTTNSPPLAMGLWWIIQVVFGLRLTSHPETRDGVVYHHININSDAAGGKGKHLRLPSAEVKSVTPIAYVGWLFDLETSTGTFAAGIGNTWVHNSPRRGPNFVTRKITMGIAAIKAGTQDKLFLGNLDAKRDWGHAWDYVRGMYAMLHHAYPDDYVLATGETHSVREFCEIAFDTAGLGEYQNYVVIDPTLYRPSEVDVLIGDHSKAREILGWQPTVRFEDLVREMLAADMDEMSTPLTKAA